VEGLHELSTKNAQNIVEKKFITRKVMKQTSSKENVSQRGLGDENDEGAAGKITAYC